MPRTFQELMAELDEALVEVEAAKVAEADALKTWRAAQARRETAVRVTRELQSEFREKVDGVIGEPSSDRVRES